MNKIWIIFIRFFFFKNFIAKLNRQQQRIQAQENKQDEIATSMVVTTKNLLHHAKNLNYVVKADEKVCYLNFDSYFRFLFIDFYLET